MKKTNAVLADHGIVFSGPMVRAILDGVKSQTRRIIRDMPDAPEPNCHPMHKAKHAAPYFDVYCGGEKTADNPRGAGEHWCWWQVDDRQCLPQIKAPHGPIGRALWVKETWRVHGGEEYEYQKERSSVIYDADTNRRGGVWRNPMFMPRWASRLNLQVTGVRAERVQAISDADIAAEGVTAQAVRALDAEVPEDATPIDLWRIGWSALHGFASWKSNPWVWAYDFRVVPQ